jgi:hypothetical protein
MGVALSTSTDSSTDGGEGSGAADAANGQEQQSNTQSGQQSDGASSGGSDRGFPENTPVKDMTVDQQAAYYKHHNRKSEDRLKDFKGVTPEQVQQMAQELESLREKGLSADQKAIKDAEKSGRAAADEDWRPKYQTLQLKAIASEVLKGDQLKAWLAGMNPAAFADENGDIDEEKVMGHLTAAFGSQDVQQQSTSGRQQPPVWGQQSGGTGVPVRPGEAGRAALAKRHGVKTP